MQLNFRHMFRQEEARLRDEHDVLDIRRVVLELFTPHCRGAHAASRGKTGFRIYVVASRGRSGRSGPHPRVMEDLL